MQSSVMSFLGKSLLLSLWLHFAHGDVTSDLATLQEAFFRWHEEQAPEFSTYIGHRHYNDRLANFSLEVFDTQRARVEQFLAAASSIDTSELSRPHRYSYDVFMDTLHTLKDNYAWKNYGALNPVTFLEGFYLDLDSLIQTTPFSSKADYENFVTRLQARPTQINQMMTRMRQSIQLGTTYHNVSVRTVPGQISAVISIAPQDSTLYKPFKSALDNLTLTQTQKDDLKARGLSAMKLLWSSLGQLKDFMEKTYSQHTRGSYGVGGLPSGGNYYRACLKWHLSVDMSPAEVHQTGLREVDRIQGLMTQVMRKQGFTGTVREYYNKLQNDPQFHRNSSDAILQTYSDLIFNRISPKLPQLFKDIPPNKVVVKPLPYDGPVGMYSAGTEDGSMPGTFYVNVHRPDEATTYLMVSLSLHEAVPGHHLQSVYQMATKLPDFQKFIDYTKYFLVPYHFPFYTAYTEGWGLYAEFLGEEMGVYTNDYELMGRYGFEMFRACRLVVDTGMHFLGWSRNQAIRYLTERTAMRQAEVEIEIDRYLTWPGQACAYKIGELKIKELRQKASRALGAKFDLRDFHSLLLTNGPVPLNVMQTIVDDYIADHSGNAGGQPVVG